MQEVNPLTDQERFTKDLRATYHELPVLWDKNHPHYKSRVERSDAFETLLYKSREYYPEADEDFVKMKIDSLRSSFRKEWRKVCFSKASAKKPEDVHKPNLWYYNLLLFTVGEKPCSEESETRESLRIFWPREYSTMLIGLLKKHPCLYVSYPASSLSKRNTAINKITEEMNIYTGRTFSPDHIRKKIQLLKGQYRFECKKIRERRRINPKKPYRPNLWCFNMLGFLKEHVFQKTQQVKSSSRKLTRQSKEESEQAEAMIISETEDIQAIKEEADSEQDMDSLENYIDKNNSDTEMALINGDYDDIFDTIEKQVAHKLREMTDDQRKHAEKLVNEVMYHGLMENLTDASKLNLESNY